jgi:hypothetical protein
MSMFEAGDLIVTHSSLINHQDDSLVKSESGILVGDFDIMYPMIIATDVDSIRFSNICTWNRIEHRK